MDAEVRTKAIRCFNARTARPGNGALKVMDSDFRTVQLPTKRTHNMLKTSAQLRAELAEAEARELADSGKETKAFYRGRMQYWRQRAGEARGIVRDNDAVLDKASAAIEQARTEISALKAQIKSQRKHWIGPKVPPKVDLPFSRSN